MALALGYTFVYIIRVRTYKLYDVERIKNYVMQVAEQKTIQSFTDLRAWKEGHTLVLMVYGVTRDFPKEELFGLVNQLRRAVVSVTSNIAEGFSRNSWKDKLHFWIMSLGSLTEVQNQLLVARDVSYMNSEVFQQLAEQTIVVSKITNSLIKSTKNVIHNS